MDTEMVILKLAIQKLEDKTAMYEEIQKTNHKQNRADIQHLNQTTENLVKDIHKIEIQFARMGGYAAGAGAGVAIIVKIIEHIWK